MPAGGLTKAGLAQMHDVMGGHVDHGDVPGLVWLVARRGEVHVGEAGSLDAKGGDPVWRDSIFRISSMTKPIVAVAALILVEECRLRLDDPVDSLLPELADRQVLARRDGPLDDTVPANRPITLRDLLTFRLGWGMDFNFTDAQPVLDAMGELDLGVGPPAPSGPPEPDEWMRRLGTLPLECQPGERWLYDIGADVLGVLVARATGLTLGSFFAERIFEPLGMTDTGFFVPVELERLGPCYWTGPETGTRELYDPPDGQWSRRPAFPSGRGGLVSTIDDYWAFAEMLRAGGVYRGRRIVSRRTVETMTTNQLTPEQVAGSGLDDLGALGWGFGVGVQLTRTGPTRSAGAYGWDGGLGSSWANDPAEDLIGILLTNRMFSSPTLPPVVADFWTCAYGAIDD